MPKIQYALRAMNKNRKRNIYVATAVTPKQKKKFTKSIEQGNRANTLVYGMHRGQKCRNLQNNIHLFNKKAVCKILV